YYDYFCLNEAHNMDWTYVLHHWGPAKPTHGKSFGIAFVIQLPLDLPPTPPSSEEQQATISLKLHHFQVVELKVGLHCDECIKKILKAIKKIRDIETYDVDTQLNKVTVTGNVTTEEVIRVIQKIGKTAITWDGEELNC
ncbi:hypothetical protein Tsubulata_041085, partial [Turnera subulata]